MSSFLEMIDKHSTRNGDKIRKIVEPLNSHFGIKFFHYHRVNLDGSFEVLTYPPDVAEYFYSSDFYKYSPYQVHPNSVKEGLSIWNKQEFQGTEEISQFIKKTYHSSDLPSYIEKDEKGYSTFTWCAEYDNKDAYQLMFHDFHLLRSFFSYYKTQIYKISRTLRENRIDMAAELGEYFYQFPGVEYGISSEKRSAFLKDVGVEFPLSRLSPREIECVELYKRGFNAKDTARTLNVSYRTVESYFENIKTKLNCFRKKEILEKFFSI